MNPHWHAREAVMLMHQGIGLVRFNDLPRRGAIHALYECCCSTFWAERVAAGRPYDTHEALLTFADSALFELADIEVDDILQGHPGVARRSHTTTSALEQCAVHAPDEATMRMMLTESARYEQRFGYPYLWFAAGRDAAALLDDLALRLTHSPEIERKTMLSELAKVNRTRLERMLGPAGGYDNYC